MSRPFSYNDENFTVIGNVLFFHVLFEGSITVGVEIAAIPPEIFKRLNSYSVSLYSSQPDIGVSNSVYSNFYINAASNLVSGGDTFRSYAKRYFYGFIVLKDI